MEEKDRFGGKKGLPDSPIPTLVILPPLILFSSSLGRFFLSPPSFLMQRMALFSFQFPLISAPGSHSPTFLPSPHSSSHFSPCLSLTFPRSPPSLTQQTSASKHSQAIFAPCPDVGIGRFNPVAASCSAFGGAVPELKTIHRIQN